MSEWIGSDPYSDVVIVRVLTVVSDCVQKLKTTCHQMQQRCVALLQQGIPDESLICTSFFFSDPSKPHDMTLYSYMAFITCPCASRIRVHTVELLSVNDELNNAFERFAVYEQRRHAALAAVAVQEAAFAAPTPAANANANSNSSATPLIGSPLTPGDPSINMHPADTAAATTTTSGAVGGGVGLHPDLRELAHGVGALGIMPRVQHVPRCSARSPMRCGN